MTEEQPQQVEAAKPTTEPAEPVAETSSGPTDAPDVPIKEQQDTQDAQDTDENKQMDDEEEPPSKTLFVSNISWKVKRNDLKAPFEKFGSVTDCKIINYYDKNQNRVKSKGYGFVTFETEEEAAAAKSGLQGQSLQDRDLVVKFSTSSGPKGKTPRKPSDEEEQKGERPEEANEGEKPGGAEGKKPRGRRRRKKKDADGKTTMKDDAKQAEASLPDDYRTLFLKTFPHKVQEDDVKAVFKDLPVPSTVNIINRSRRGRVTALRAFAFVTFDTHDDAKTVYETCTGGKKLMLGEKELVIQVSRKQPGSTDNEKGEGDESPESSGGAKAMTKRGGRKRLYVSGLGDETTDTQLMEKFAEFGTITKCQVKVSKKPDNPVKFAYVNFQEASQAEAALKAMNETMLQEAKLSVEYARIRRRGTGANATA